MKKVSASNHSVAAGRDARVVNITIHNVKIDDNSLYQALSDKTDLPIDRIKEMIGRIDFSEVSPAHILQIVETFFSIYNLQDTIYTHRYSSLAKTASSLSRDFTKIKAQSEAVDESIAQKDYHHAHALLGELIKSDVIPSAIKKEISFDYFHTGFLAHANFGDRDAMQTLYSTLIESDFESEEYHIPCLALEINQEYATRDSKDMYLIENLNSLEHLTGSKKLGGDNSQYAHILLGLAQRRLGERGRLKYIDESISTFSKLLEESPEGREIEIRNYLGIAHVRRFEALGEEEDLVKSEQLMSAVQEPDGPINLSEYAAYPKLLNNLGNVYKQRIRINDPSHNYIRALEQYFKAEQIWSERSAPYEWAMLQKNKAGAKLMFFKTSSSTADILQDASANVKDALKYRTEAAAPYQYRETIQIQEEIENLLTSELDSD